MSDYNAKKYFMYGFRRLSSNENKYLVKTEAISLTRILENLDEIIDDYSYDLSNAKLKRSLVDYLNLSEFYFKSSIINKICGLEIDLKTFYSIISKFTKNEEQIFEKNISKKLFGLKLIVSMLYKKITSNDLFSRVVNLTYTTSNFAVIDKILAFMINELVYSGHSLTYISDWCKEHVNYSDISEENINENIEMLKSIKMDDAEFNFYISIYKGRDLLNNISALEENVKIKLIEYEVFNTSLEGEYRNHLQNANDYDLYKITTMSKDKYSGLKYIIESINSFYQLSVKIDKFTKKIVSEKIIVADNLGEHSKLLNRNYDQNTLYSLVESKEKKDIKKFIDYRNNMLVRGEYSDEITVIQRSLNLITQSIGVGIEAKLINMWSSAEYILTYTEGQSIIGKVKDIIPKLVVMYFMHEKLNSFWYRLLRKRERLQNPQPEVLNEIFSSCKKEDDRYDTEKLARYILDNGEEIASRLDFDIVLKRDILDIGTLLYDKKLRKKALEKALKNAEHELVYIYRLRNMIVHAAKKRISANELDCLRLYQYNNNLLGMIVFYKDLNSLSTLSEILHTVTFSYENYIRNIIESDDIIQICKPDYVLL